MQSTVELMRCRSVLPGASIFHTHPLSQTLFSIFLFLEAPPTGFIAGVYKIANHKRAVVLCCLRHIQRRNKGQPSTLAIIFLGCNANVSVFSWEIKEPSPPPPPKYLSS